MDVEQHEKFMQMAIDMATNGMNNNIGGPFGCIVVKDGEIVGKGCNSVASTNDPTAHAEVVAIRDACKNLHSFQLDGCFIYTSCEPCPMCLGAIYWARPVKVYYGCTRQDAAAYQFDDDFIYKEMELPFGDRKIPMYQCNRKEAVKVFRAWKEKDNKTEY
jgi:tRNA(Arg) A34 adenosine deaminase TadA